MNQNVQIYINDTQIDIDDSTAIGVNFAGFSTESLGQISLSHTNTFSIPITNHNRKALGFLDNMNMNNQTIQSAWYGGYNFKMYTDGMYVFGGQANIDTISNGRINLYIVRSRGFADALSEYSMWDATQAIATVLNTELNTQYPSGATWDNIVDYMADGSNTAWIPYSVGTLSKQYPYSKYDEDNDTYSCGNKYDDTDNDDNRERFNLNTETKLTTEFITNDTVVGDYKTGCIYVNLYTLLSTVLNNLGWNITIDSNVYLILSRQYIRMSDLVTYMDITTYHYSFMANDTYSFKIGDEGGAPSRKITFLDLIKYVCQEYCLLFEEANGSINFHSINNIADTTLQTLTVIGQTSRTFYLDNVPQESYITYEALGDNTTLTGSKQIICHNEKIERGSGDTVLFSIKRYLPSYFAYLYDNGQVSENTYALNTTETQCNEKFVIVQRQTSLTSYTVKVSRYFLGQEYSSYTQLYRAINRTVGEMGFWDTFAGICEYPEKIVVTVLMNPYDITTFKPWKRVKFNTIPGEWLVSSISGYNPRLNNPEVEITAFRLR